jgi:hypothetical protein
MCGSKRTWIRFKPIAAGMAMLAALAYLSGCPRSASKNKDTVARPGAAVPLDASVVDASHAGSEPGPPHNGFMACSSPDGKYRVTLRFPTPTSSMPSHAVVYIDGQAPLDSAETTGVTIGGAPRPDKLTCSSEDDSNAFCYVAGTADYGYIAKVSLVGGRRRVELLKNGVASTWLANFDCP